MTIGQAISILAASAFFALFVGVLAYAAINRGDG